MAIVLQRLKKCSKCATMCILWQSNPKLCKKCTLQSNVKTKHKNKPISIKSNKKGANINKYKRKPTGEKELFLSIWLKKQHKCENCGVYLGEEPRTFFFSHIKSKGAYPELRLVEDNIELLCLECHQAWETNKDKYHSRRNEKTHNSRHGLHPPNIYYISEC